VSKKEGTLRDPRELAPCDGEDLRATRVELFVGGKDGQVQAEETQSHKEGWANLARLLPLDDDDKQATLMTEACSYHWSDKKSLGPQW
jgi:hypothetical protein